MTMTLLAYGLNHMTPLSLRERIAFSPERAKLALKELKQQCSVNEAVILSTCNRVEIYSQVEDVNFFHDWLVNRLSFPTAPYGYSYKEEKAVSHLMRVASGLDSMVLGEPQILGQLKEAFSLAQEAGTIGKNFHRLFQRVLNVSKQVRTDTKIGESPITLGFAVLTLAKRIFSDLSKNTVLLIGAGDIIELTALHLYHQGIRRFVVASRSEAKAKKLIEKIHGHWIPLSEISLYLRQSDIVISATSSELPILGKGAVEQAIKARRHKPIFMVDLAVPRDIEPEVASLEDIYLYDLEGLKTITEQSHQCRQEAAKKAEEIIALQAQHYIRDLQSLDANQLIHQFREKLNHLSQGELQRAYSRLEQGNDVKKVMDEFVYNFINKFAHTPCIKMKQTAYEGRLELLAFARELLGLEE